MTKCLNEPINDKIVNDKMVNDKMVNKKSGITAAFAYQRSSVSFPFASKV